MSGIRRVANHFKYMLSNWIIVAAGFVLILAAILVVGSLSRAGGDVRAADYYQNGGYPASGQYSDTTDDEYYRNGGYPVERNTSYYSGDYYKNGGYPAQHNNYSNDYYKNGGYPVGDKYHQKYDYQKDKDYYKHGGYPVKDTNRKKCHHNCGHKPKPTHKPKAHYSCDYLRVTKIGDRQVRLTTRASASGAASIVGYRYEFGDGVVRDGSSSITHTYNRNGTFTARAWVKLRVHGQHKWTTSNDCTQTVTVKKHKHHHDCSRYGNHHCKPRPTPSHTPCACDDNTKDDNDYGYHGDKDHHDNYGGGSSTNDNSNQNTNVNHNNSSANATATAKVTVKQAKASAATAAAAPAAAPATSGGKYPVTELPKTGPEDAIIGTIGMGSLVAAGAAYASSRKELLDTIFRR